jgi:hypothetical protein
MNATLEALDICTLWEQALTFDRFVAEAAVNQALWSGVHRQAQIPTWAWEAAATLGPLRLLVLAEDWCNDTVSTVPVLARLAEAVPGIELRILRRDEHPEVMDQYLTDGARSIPVVILLNERCEEIGRWGPRPAFLQEWVLANRGMEKAARNLEVRKWYARDRGETLLREVLDGVRRET